MINLLGVTTLNLGGPVTGLLVALAICIGVACCMGAPLALMMMLDAAEEQAQTGRRRRSPAHSKTRKPYVPHLRE